MKKLALIFFLSSIYLSLFAQEYDPALGEDNYNDQHWKEAYEQFCKLLKNPQNKTPHIHLRKAVKSLEHLNKLESFDELLESTIKIYPNNFHLLTEAGRQYDSCYRKYGSFIDNRFIRDGGSDKSVKDRDRVRAIQLFYKAMNLMPDRKLTVKEKDAFYLEFSKLFKLSASWKMLKLTNYKILPDFDKYYNNQRSERAPVDENGVPVFYTIPGKFEDAKSDGERWRWLINQSSDCGSLKYAQFLRDEFGVTTLRDYYDLLNLPTESKEFEKSIFALDTLTDNETSAELSSGLKRFQLPTEHSFIKIYHGEANRGNAQCWSILAEIYEDRHQFLKAARYWQKYLELNPDDKYAQDSLKQITGNWCWLNNRTDPVAAGEKPVIRLCFRNANKVSFTATRIDWRKIIKDKFSKGDSKTYFTSLQHFDFAHDLISEKGKKYLKEEAAKWEVKLSPLPNHYDKTVKIKAPLTKAGVYLIKATMPNGNTSHAIAEVNDIFIVKKYTKKGDLYLITDAKNGKPLSGVEVEFFGWKEEELQNEKVERNDKNKPKLKYYSFTRKSDSEGQIILTKDDIQDFYLYPLAKTHTGFNYHSINWQTYGKNDERDNLKAILVTDRPVYRPGQTIFFKGWCGNNSHKLKGKQSLLCNQKVKLKFYLYGTLFAEKEFKTDSFGAFSGEYKLCDGSRLGRCVINVYTTIKGKEERLGRALVKIEEYKKPEYSVTVETEQKLFFMGDKIAAKIKAQYNFGQPVKNATVKVNIERCKFDDIWFPITQWDWLYGNGFAFDDERVKIKNIHQPKYPWDIFQRPEAVFVSQHFGRINNKGEFEFEINTESDKQLYKKGNFKYQVTAEVTDQSRRTVQGRGEILATGEPFLAYIENDHRFYTSGELVQTSLIVKTLDRQLISGTAQINLFNESDSNKNKPLHTWQKGVMNGYAELSFKVNKPGKYRLTAKVTDSAGNCRNVSKTFFVHSDSFNAINCTFKPLEITPDKKTYQTGEKAKLLINTEEPNSTVYLFVKKEFDSAIAPQAIYLSGKSKVIEIPVNENCQPNFFVEAFTVNNSKLHVSTKLIAVPPKKRTFNIDIQPQQRLHKPGERTKLRLRVTDDSGKPFQGNLALTVYDKSLESFKNIYNKDIKEVFWNWRYYHNTMVEKPFDYRVLFDWQWENEPMKTLGYFGLFSRGISYAQIPLATYREELERICCSMSAPDNRPFLESVARKERDISICCG